MKNVVWCLKDNFLQLMELKLKIHLKEKNWSNTGMFSIFPHVNIKPWYVIWSAEVTDAKA